MPDAIRAGGRRRAGRHAALGARGRGRRRPRGGRPDRLVRGWMATSCSGRPGRRRDRVGIVPDGALGGPRPRRHVRLRRAAATTLPARLPPHALHGTVLDRRWQRRRRALHRDRARTGLAVRAASRSSGFELLGRIADLPSRGPGRRAHAGLDRLASVVRPATGRRATASCELDDRRRRRCTVRDAAGHQRRRDAFAPPPGPWDDCFTDLRRPPVLRWPGFLELDDRVRLPRLGRLHRSPRTRCASSRRRRRPTRSTASPAIVEPGRPLTADDDLVLAVARGLRRSSSAGGRDRGHERQPAGELGVGQRIDLRRGHRRHGVRVDRRRRRWRARPRRPG